MLGPNIGREERVYDHGSVNLEVLNYNMKDPGSLYSLPLPTDPCPAYDTIK